MKTISLIYGYSSRNAGDFAITLGAIDVLLECGVNIKLFSRYCAQNKDFYDSKKLIEARYGNLIHFYESPFCLDRTDSKFKTLINYADGALTVLGLKRNTTFRKELLNSDVVVFNGGNLFRCHSFVDFTRLHALMYPLKLALNKKKPIIIFPQSASKLNKEGQRLLLPILQHAEMVYFREKESYNYIQKFISDQNFFQSIDLAFFIKKNGIVTAERFQNKIAITLRFHTVGDIKYLSSEKILHIKTQISKIVDAYRSNNDFIIIVQTDKDEELSKDIASDLNIEIYKSNDPIELLSIYKSCSMLIGMRLHSIILALSIGTPCFGLFFNEWGLKNPGLMQYFHMPYMILDNNKAVDAVHMDSISDLLNNRDRYSMKLRSIIDSEHLKLLNNLLCYLKK